MKFVHQVERSARVAPRKGVFSIWDVAPNIADDLGYDIKELIPEAIRRARSKLALRSELALKRLRRR
jgi:hypothetical protein